ncbi:cilia- and flagella-associated protein 57 isoform X2 [Nilaparvata lugens]|uniref:cilia- and flagella-associated protein 57 isoform X2 n=1 Tax=Nilaparvata lugens TaxID=108931 RepID=UPI00193EA289|nr:cilia- and flagella-associated protein 57 isoform X2 [Nilaparvata lugens]
MDPIASSIELIPTVANDGVPVLEPHMFLGLNPTIKGNATYLTDHNIIYPAGGVLVIHDYVQQEQKYIKLPDASKVISRIVISPNKKLVAVAEEGDKPCIILFDLLTLKKKKVLGLPYESSVRQFASVCFTHDSKYVLAVTGDPDWMMLQYNWVKGKVETSVKANNPPASPGPVMQVAANPLDSCVVCVVGPGLFRLLASSEMAWRQWGFQKAENLPCCSCCWLAGDVTLVGTRDGRLVVVEGGDLRALYRAGDAPHVNIKEDRYRKVNVFKIVAGDVGDGSTKNMNKIQNISVSPSQEALLCTTKRMQIYYVKLWGKDISQGTEVNFKMIGVSLHHGPVAGLALCSWKQIMMTCGELDHIVRIWDYTNTTVIMEKKYAESIYTLALHPTGLYAVMGFKDRLEYKLVLIDDLKSIRTFPIRTCNEARFSKSGHMFAAVNMFDIQIYSTITFHLVFTFKGHTGKINSLLWTQNDLALLSCGEDGSFCEWDLFEGKNVVHINTDNCQNDLAAATSKTAYCASKNGVLREIQYGQISKEIDLKQTQLDKVVLSRSDLMMFVAGDDGSIHSLKFPWNEEPQFLTFTMHNHRIVKMKLSYDDQTLISCSEDGTMCIWKVTRAEGKQIAMDPQFTYSNEILIGKNELRAKINTIGELSVRIKELDQEQVLRTRDMETAHKEKVEELRSGYCTAIEELKEKNQELEMTHTVEIDKINTQIDETKVDHDLEMTRLEKNYEGKLVVEFQKYTELQEKFEIWRAEFDKKYEELKEVKQLEIEEMIANYELKVKEEEAKLDQLHADLKQRNEKHEENKNLIEDDTDKELVELRTVNEAQLQTEREANIKLRADTHMMKNRFVLAQREIEDLNIKVVSLQKEQKQLKLVIKGIEKDINDLNKENTERDNLIHEKERGINELRMKHQELEKFKSILDCKMEDTREQLKPKENEIKKKGEQLTEMNAEKDRILIKKAELEFENRRLLDKLRGSKAALAMEIKKNNADKSELTQILKGVLSAHDVIDQPHRLKEAVMKLCYRTKSPSEGIVDKTGDHESGSDLVKKIEHFEKCLDTYTHLQEKMSKSSSKKNDKLKSNNTWLVMERNRLRQELEMMQNHVKDLKCVVGPNAARMMPSEARKRLQVALKTRDEIKNIYKGKVQGYIEKINALQTKLDNLHKKCRESELRKELDETSA